MRQPRSSYIDVYGVGILAEWMNIITAMNCILSSWKLFAYFRASKKLSLLISTIFRAAETFAFFIIILIVFLMAYALAFYTAFHNATFYFKSFSVSMRTLTLALLSGDTSAWDHDIYISNRYLAPALLFVFLFFCSTLVLSMMVAIIDDAFMETQHEIDQGYKDPIFFAIKHRVGKAGAFWGKISKRGVSAVVKKASQVVRRSQRSNERVQGGGEDGGEGIQMQGEQKTAPDGVDATSITVTDNTRGGDGGSGGGGGDDDNHRHHPAMKALEESAAKQGGRPSSPSSSPGGFRYQRKKNISQGSGDDDGGGGGRAPGIRRGGSDRAGRKQPTMSKQGSQSRLVTSNGHTAPTNTKSRKLISFKLGTKDHRNKNRRESAQTISEMAGVKLASGVGITGVESHSDAGKDPKQLAREKARMMKENMQFETVKRTIVRVEQISSSLDAHVGRNSVRQTNQLTRINMFLLHPRPVFTPTHTHAHVCS